MRNRYFIYASFLLALNAIAQTSSRVIVISIDGAKPEVVHQVKMPVLKKLAAEGASSWDAQTVYPSITLPSHVSMLSGVEPEVHKILWNDWFKENGFVDVPTIFSLANKQKLRTAMFVAKEKFKHFEVPGTLDKFSLIESGVADLMAALVVHLRSDDPSLTFVHIAEADYTGHKFGWGSTEQKKALETIDNSLGTLMKYLASVKQTRPYTVIVSADHGGTAKGHGSRSPADMTIPWLAWGQHVKKVKLKSPISTKDTAVTALKLLGISPIPHMTGRYVAEAFTLEASSR